MERILTRLAVAGMATLILMVLIPAYPGYVSARAGATADTASALPYPEAITPEPGEHADPEPRAEPKPVELDANPTACTFSLGSTKGCFGQGGGNSSVALMTSQPTGCPWTAVSNASWITITAGASGDGPSDIAFTVSPNSGVAGRQGTLTIAGLTFTVSESSLTSCALPLIPSSQNFPGQGGSGTTQVPLLTACTCTWQASTDFPDWITINSGGSASSTKTAFTYTIAPNTTNASRSGDINAAGQDFVINQSSGCTYAISPGSQSFGLAGGNGSFNLTTNSFCTWSAGSNVSWITITSAPSGSGNAQIAYSVTANSTGLARTGVISVGDQAFSISQDGMGCGYSLSPGFVEAGSGGIASLLTISATSGCAWTATSNESWIRITSAATGTGNGVISFVAASNAGGGARTGTISVADQTFIVDQAGPSDQADLSVSVTASPQPVAAGNQLTYTTVVTNAGPDKATGVTLTEAVPDGASFSSVKSVGVTAAPGPGQTGTVSCSLGAIQSGKSATVSLVVDVLASPGNTLTLTAQAQSLASDPVPANNSATNATQILGGGIVSLSWTPAQSTDADPTPAPTAVTVGIAKDSQPAVERLRHPAADSAAEKQRATVVAPEGSACSLTGFNVYISSATPVQITPANLWETVPPSTTATVPVGPSGSFYVVTTLWNCGGSIIESDGGVTSSGTDAGVPAGPVIDSVIIGNKMKASGTGFGSPVQVFIDGVTFVKPSVLKKAST
ncbi:MAG: BACON domain-containing protein, partial [Blastocatellia bacterium]